MRLPFSTYSGTRPDADVQRRVNVYPHSKGGVRQFPGLVEFADITKWSGLIDLSPTDNILEAGDVPATIYKACFTVQPDGRKLWIVADSAVDTIWEFDLSSPHLLTTIASTPDRTFLFTHIGAPDVVSIRWGNSGAKLFVVQVNNAAYQYTASTPYDVTTLVFVDAGPSNLGLQTRSIAFNFDGTKFYMQSMTDQKVYQFPLSTAWDIHNATGDANISLDYSSLIASGVEVCMEADPTMGTIVIVPNPTAPTTALIYQWSLYSPGELDTATLDGSFDGSALIEQYQCIAWAQGTTSEEGGRLYTFGTIGGALIWRTWKAKASYNVTGENGRGAINMDGVLYVIIQSILFSVDAAGVGTLIGDIDPGAADMATDGTNLVITVGVKKYVYTVAGGLVINTDSDIGDAFTSAYLDLRFYYDQPEDKFIASNLNAPLSAEPEDIGAAESFQDKVTAVFSHNQFLYVFGPTKIEPWITTGVDRPPIARQEIIERGIAGRSAIASIDNKIYFLDQTGRPNVMSLLEYKPILAPALQDEWDLYTIFDCVVNTYAFQKENFAEFYFPAQNVTWTFHEPSSQWNKREDTSNAAFNAAYYVNVYDKLLALDRTNGKIYELSKTIYQDDGSAITRTIDTDIISSELDGVENKRITPKRLKLTIFALTGSTTISVSQSIDLSTFGTARTVTLNAGLNYVFLDSWEEFLECIFRITTTANDRIEIIDADLRVGYLID